MTDEAKPTYELEPEEPRRLRISRRVVILGLVAVAAVLLIGGVALATRPQQVPSWPSPPNAQVAPLAAKAGLSILPQEGVREHIHAHLNVTLNGEPITVPAHIGIDTAEKRYSEIHTHDTSGILHVESQRPRLFYLRQAFVEWNVPLTAHGIGGYVPGKDGVKVGAFVNQQPYTGDLRELELSDRQDITIAITTDGDEPVAEPQFDWPANY